MVILNNLLALQNRNKSQSIISTISLQMMNNNKECFQLLAIFYQNMTPYMNAKAIKRKKI